jgi:hypothetical protein
MARTLAHTCTAGATGCVLPVRICSTRGRLGLGIRAVHRNAADSGEALALAEG